MKKLKKSIRTNHGEMNPKKISVCRIVATTRCTIILARFEKSLLYPTTYYSAKKQKTIDVPDNQCQLQCSLLLLYVNCS